MGTTGHRLEYAYDIPIKSLPPIGDMVRGKLRLSEATSKAFWQSLYSPLGSDFIQVTLVHPEDATGLSVEDISALENLSVGQSLNWQTVARAFDNVVSPRTREESAETALLFIRSRLPAPTFNTELIPTYRSSCKGSAFGGNDGVGLVDGLAQLRDTPWKERERSKRRWEGVVAFLQDVLADPTAELHIPYARDTLEVTLEGKVMPLENLGTGIEQVILIGVYCTLHRDCIVCIEEPENHLHPILQRKLVNHLQNNTTNQYFIATHSAAFINMEDAALFHVSNDGKEAEIHRVGAFGARRLLTDAFGYQASDIV